MAGPWTWRPTTRKRAQATDGNRRIERGSRTAIRSAARASCPQDHLTALLVRVFTSRALPGLSTHSASAGTGVASAFYDSLIRRQAVASPQSNALLDTETMLTYDVGQLALQDCLTIFLAARKAARPRCTSHALQWPAQTGQSAGVSEVAQRRVRRRGMKSPGRPACPRTRG